MNFIQISVFVLFCSICRAHLVLRTAGSNSTFVANLNDGDVFCPTDYPSGLTVLCHGSPTDTSAKFIVNGKFVRKESTDPFFIAGDQSRIPNAWIDIPKDVTIECVLRPTGMRHTAQISFLCDGIEKAGTKLSAEGIVSPDDIGDPLPASLFFVPVYKTDRDINPVPLHDDMTFCPNDSFGTPRFSIRCMQSTTSKWAKFHVNGAAVRNDKKAPYYIFKGLHRDNTIPRPWRNYPDSPFDISCELSNGPINRISRINIKCQSVTDREETPLPQPAFDGSEFERVRAGCVFIDPRDTTLASGWEPVSDGVAYMPDNPSQKITGAGKASMIYTLVPPSTSRYAIVLDMTTNGGSEHNDVWVRMEGGIQIMRRGVARTVSGWTKGYHNKRGRAAIISTVDRNAHSMASALVLRQGSEYKFGVGGRSTKVIVHRILFFPCEGKGCQRGGWRETQNTCIPDSI